MADLLSTTLPDGTTVYYGTDGIWRLSPAHAKLFLEAGERNKKRNDLRKELDLEIRTIEISPKGLKRLVQMHNDERAELIAQRVRNLIDRTGPRGMRRISLYHSAEYHGISNVEVDLALETLMSRYAINRFASAGDETFTAVEMTLYEAEKAADEARAEKASEAPGEARRRGSRSRAGDTTGTAKKAGSRTPTSGSGGPWTVERVGGSVLWTGADKQTARREARRVKGSGTIVIKDGTGTVTNTYGG